MIARKGNSRTAKWVGLLLEAVLAVPALYLVVALFGSFIPINSDWSEASQGTTIYIAGNGIHADIIMPVDSDGLSWAPLFLKKDFVSVPNGARWIAFGSGEREVYLDTPRWQDIRPSTVWSALAGGPRLIHVEYVANPYYAVRAIRLRKDEYRRLWLAIRNGFEPGRDGAVQRVDHRGYGPSDAFYRARGNASAILTCNVVVAHWLADAGVKTSLWPPFISGLVWRYRKT